MKTVLKFYLIPFLILVILNAFLFLFITDYQENISSKVQIADVSNDYISMIQEVSSELDRFLVSKNRTDSLNYIRTLDQIEDQTNTLISYFPTQEERTDALTSLSIRYIEKLRELRINVSTLNTATFDEYLAFESELEQIQHDIMLILNQLNLETTKVLRSDVNESETILTYLFVVYILLLIAILLVTYQLLVRPLIRLRKEIEKLSIGSYSQIDIHRDDEIGQLVDAFNETSATLKRSEDNLRNSNKMLESANKELETFAYSVSHDLRSPLRSISGFSEALVSNYSDELSEKAQDYLSRVHKAAQKMGVLIDDILKLSRITRKGIQKTEINISELAKELIELTTTEDEKAVFDFEVEEGLNMIADKGMVKVILLNLLSNAIKFSKSTAVPKIKVGKSNKDGKPFIYVKDNGIGLDMKYADKIFGAFQRLHADSEFEGTGIGLATVKRIVNKHGGEIYLESVLGEGTTVYFNLGTR